jgi:hypothetical protein
VGGGDLKGVEPPTRRGVEERKGKSSGLIPVLPVSSFHIWRPVTALFYYPLSPQTGFHFLINLYFLYNYRYSPRLFSAGCCPIEYKAVYEIA